MRKYDCLLKFTKLKGNFLYVAFIDLTTRKEYRYGKQFTKRPDWDEQRDYVRQVLEMCGVVSTWCDPLKN